MEYPPASYYYPPQAQPLRRRPRPAARWVKEWIPQDLSASSGKCSLFKWVREDVYINLKENTKGPEPEVLKPEPTTEILFLCSYEGCGKTFVDVGALRKHAHVHGERQYICQEPGCGKKFLDSSKLKRHNLTHTGQRDFLCPHPGCGKAGTSVAVRHTPVSDKPQGSTKTSTPAAAHSFVERPHVCPYEGCEKAYIHGYKLNLHLKTQHPEHNLEDIGKLAAPAGEHAVNETSDYDAYAGIGGLAPNSKRSKTKTVHKAPPAKVYNVKISSTKPANVSGVRNQWPSKAMYEDDSEETEEDQDNNIEDGWRYGNLNADDEETEDED